MKRTIYFKNKPCIIATSSIAGPKESQGSIAKYIETKDEKWLKFDKKPPYINRLILFLIS